MPARLGGQRNLQGERIDMMAIGDDAAIAVTDRRAPRRPCRARVRQLAHGIEEMGEAAAHRRSSAAVASAAVASEWPRLTMMPASRKRAIAAGGVVEGATVRRTMPQSSLVSHAMSLAAMVRMKLRVVGAAPLRDR